MRMSISRFNKYQQCPRLYGIEYVMGYRDLTPKPWLAFGSGFDDLMAYIDVEGIECLETRLPELFPDEFKRADAEFLARTWFKKYGKDLQAPIDVNGKPGNQCEIELDMSHLVDDEFELIMTGFIDKVYEDKGYMAINERKTTSDPINYNSVYWNRLNIDPQIIGYSYGLGKMLGCDINKGTYEVFRKPSDKTFFKKGTDAPEYREKLLQAVYGPLKAKRGAEMVNRKPYWITEDLRVAFERDFVDVARDIHARTAIMDDMPSPEDAWIRNKNGCDLFLPCIYKPACACKSRLQDIEYITKED